jgi:serine/threonine-protein kinase
VAIKDVTVDRREDYKYLGHIRNEFKILRSLQNGPDRSPPEGIVRVYDLLRWGFLRRRKECALVMEFVEGVDLKRERRYPLGQLVDIVTQVARALARVHAKGLIHGDVKPENILVSTSGKVTLVDFGFSCRAGSHLQSIRGTRDYMAPEQVDRGRVTEKTDIYNFGATMYYLFTGRFVPALIAQPGDEAHFIGSRDVDPHPLGTLNPSVPALLEEVVLRCVRKDPFERPSCIEEVQEILTEVGRACFH